ncbi:Na(+)/H(+) antiporter subunit C [Brachybacterium sp. FME24]|uniref:Na(+)/H(+) antiporter subunit C n=1 Tax=Brachybacterium sp. FME24 TaxID=2742605 RepID=UPI0018683348|nr:Na(+)/H(+) antiporter subunit C [Brachybacterium sp. FME24]
MSVSLALLLTAGVFIACGVYLVLERTLTRVILGFVLLGNGVNLLFIVAAGPPGNPPFEGTAEPETMTDPLPFAMVLTAIVISLGITAFGMALAYRAWQLFGHDEVPDDVEDRRVLRRRRRRSEDAEKLPWSQALSEESRRGALMHSQGFTPAGEDQLGSDLTSAEDVPQDPTEADEGQASAPRRVFRPKERAGHGADASGSATGPDHHAAGAPGAGPATESDREDPEEGGGT